jgi:hypothetical protein
VATRQFQSSSTLGCDIRQNESEQHKYGKENDHEKLRTRGTLQKMQTARGINQTSALLSHHLRWGLLRWFICGSALAISTTMHFLIPSLSFQCNAASNTETLARVWILGATVRVAAGVVIRAVIALFWSVRATPNTQREIIWAMLRCDAWVNIAGLLWATVGILFLFSPQLPCSESSLVVYCRVAAGALGFHMVRG